jgi:translation initiation factor IF-1
MKLEILLVPHRKHVTSHSEDQSMLHTDRVPVYFENHAEHTDVLRGKMKKEFLNVIEDDKYNY